MFVKCLKHFSNWSLTPMFNLLSNVTEVFVLILILIRAKSNFWVFLWINSLASALPIKQSVWIPYRIPVFCQVPEHQLRLSCPLPPCCSLPQSSLLGLAAGSWTSLACWHPYTPRPGQAAECFCSWGKICNLPQGVPTTLPYWQGSHLFLRLHEQSSPS